MSVTAAINTRKNYVLWLSYPRCAERRYRVAVASPVPQPAGVSGEEIRARIDARLAEAGLNEVGRR